MPVGPSRAPLGTPPASADSADCTQKSGSMQCRGILGVTHTATRGCAGQAGCLCRQQGGLGQVHSLGRQESTHAQAATLLLAGPALQAPAEVPAPKEEWRNTRIRLQQGQSCQPLLGMDWRLTQGCCSAAHFSCVPQKCCRHRPGDPATAACGWAAL